MMPSAPPRRLPAGVTPVPAGVVAIGRDDDVMLVETGDGEHH